jgi:hypothetical protein
MEDCGGALLLSFLLASNDGDDRRCSALKKGPTMKKKNKAPTHAL